MSNATCLAQNAVPTLPGPACAVSLFAPNATFAAKIAQCCNGAPVRHIGNSTNEVPVEQSCVSWCSYPAYAGNETAKTMAGTAWKECLGGDAVVATCQDTETSNGGAASTTTPTSPNAARRTSLRKAALVLVVGALVGVSL